MPSLDAVAAQRYRTLCGLIDKKFAEIWIPSDEGAPVALDQIFDTHEELDGFLDTAGSLDDY